MRAISGARRATGIPRPSHKAMEGQVCALESASHTGRHDRTRRGVSELPLLSRACHTQDGYTQDLCPALPTRSDFRSRPELPLLSQWERLPEAEVIPHTEGGLLPNVDRASLPMPKFESYALNPEHTSGRHKAKLFAERLGITKKDAAWLREYIRTAIKNLPAKRGKADIQGERFTVYIPITGPNGKKAVLETGWIYRRPPGSDTKKTTPSLSTVFIAKKVRHAEAAGV